MTTSELTTLLTGLWAKVKEHVTTAIAALQIPTKTSDLANDSGFTSVPYVHLDGQKFTNHTYDTLTGNGNGVTLADGQLLLVRISGNASATGYTMYINIDQAHGYPATSNKTVVAMTYNGGQFGVRCGDFPVYSQLLLRFYNNMWVVVGSGTLPTNLAAYATTSQLATKQDIRTLVTTGSALTATTYVDLGTTDTIAPTLPASPSRADEFVFTFTCVSNAPNITLPQGVKLCDGFDWHEAAAGVKFQVSIQDNEAAYLVLTPNS